MFPSLPFSDPYFLFLKFLFQIPSITRTINQAGQDTAAPTMLQKMSLEMYYQVMMIRMAMKRPMQPKAKAATQQTVCKGKRPAAKTKAKK